ncbi:MAG: hypothetical protein NC039_08080 [Muribaculaceae bacterium]|nr:hypothetical protein [Muribaculaceae bacterium]
MISRFINTIILLALTAILPSCSSSEAWDSLPSAITDFISQYYPGSNVSDYTTFSDGSISVKITNGASMRFNSDYQWTEIDGNGVTLPEVLAYDQFPPELFAYLQSTSQQRQVYEVKRDRKYYKLTMLDTVLTYEIQTGRITYPGENPAS